MTLIDRFFLAFLLLVHIVVYFAGPIVMIWLPAVFGGCFFPETLLTSEWLARLSSDPDNLIVRWVEFVQHYAPTGWSFQLRWNGGGYLQCIQSTAWDTLLLMVGLVGGFMLFGVPFAMLVGWITGKLIGIWLRPQ